MRRAGDAAPTAFLLAGIPAVLTGLCYAELAGRFPVLLEQTDGYADGGDVRAHLLYRRHELSARVLARVERIGRVALGPSRRTVTG